MPVTRLRSRLKHEKKAAISCSTAPGILLDRVGIMILAARPMKTFFRLAILVSTGLFASTMTIFGQGSLTPPAAPAPTMKTLDQIEARTPISSLPFTISSPGSYYLTKSLNVTTGNGITINAAQVTVDLNGFTISSNASSANGTGIALASGLADITIFNGHIKGGVAYLSGTYSGPGFANGIEYSGNAPVNVRVTGISVLGCLSDGINLSANAFALVESCIVQTVGGNGIVAANVSHSVANLCGNVGIFAPTVSDCYAQSTGSSDAISATNAHNCEAQNTGSGIGLYAYTASNCYGSSVSGLGLSATTATNCQGVSSGGGDGLDASEANNCYGVSNTGDGLDANQATNCYGYNTGSSGNGSVGLRADNAINCYGFTASGAYGLYAYTAAGCFGKAAGSGGSGLARIGLAAYVTANNCWGDGPDEGLSAPTATNCYGSCSAHLCTGVYATVAIGCVGLTSDGVGLQSYIANSCIGNGTQQITYKYNMP